MNEDCCNVDWERTIPGAGHFALFLHPHRGEFGGLSQEYLTGPLDKKPARQAGIELAGKVKH